MGGRACRRWVAVPVIVVVVVAKLAGCARRAGEPKVEAAGTQRSLTAERSEISGDRGRYLVLVGGCNDCHTAGYAMPGGAAVPESQWLTGMSVGWRGPWGTTYGSNLRLSVAGADEQTWVATMRARNVFPPMPWASLHAMTDADLRSLYRYIKELGGPAGKPAPAYVLPGLEPRTPYVDMIPRVPVGATTTTSQRREEGR